MDKKGLRSGQNSTQKSLATDQKKDIGNGTRPWPGGGRGGFNRGGNGSGGSALSANKNEPTRSKPRYNQQQRFGGGGFGNKRPQQRGGYYQAEGGGGTTVAPTTGLDSVISDELDDGIGPEVGSVFVQGNKKQNLNHLLNFHYTRDGADHRGSSRSGNNATGGGRARNGENKMNQGRWITTEKHKYNKEHYLQANCQFIVKTDGDYTKYLNNPDTLVDWDLIEQINIQVNEVPSCPICLYPALAAKVTRCGHVFCWSCILHYLALSDERWRKCPICYEAVHKQHLKSVVMISHATFPVNKQITFTLMKRVKGSLTAYPIDHIESPPNQSPTLSQSSPDFSSFSTKVSETPTTNTTQFLHTVSDLHLHSSIQCKLVLATTEDVLKIVERERNDLLLQKMDLVSVEINPELCFVEEAIQLLNQREVQILSKKINKNVKIQDEVDEQLNTVSQAIFGNEVIVEHRDLRSLEAGAFIGDSASIDENSDGANQILKVEEDVDFAKVCEGVNLGLELGTEAQLPGAQNHVKTFYFYQASDGQNIFLHAINARMLEHTYGSLEFAPHTISGKILEKEAGSITEQLRNRVRYLQHLPLTCQVEVAEIDLAIPIVSEETMEVFRAQLKSRQKRRNLRYRSERRREKLIHEHENRQMGRCLASSPMYTTNLHIDSTNHFPTVETSVALASAEANNTNNINAGFSGGTRLRLDSEQSESGPKSSISTSPSNSVFGSSANTNGTGGTGWWGSSFGGDGVIEEADGNGITSLAGPSFAKMVLQSPKTKKSQSSPWPILSQSKFSTNNIEASFSSKANESTSRQRSNRNGNSEDSDADSEDYVSVPAYNKSFSDAIAMALEKAAMQNDVKSKDGDGHVSTGGKKKKKSKQKILFATSMSFTGQ